MRRNLSSYSEPSSTAKTTNSCCSHVTSRHGASRHLREESLHVPDALRPQHLRRSRLNRSRPVPKLPILANPTQSFFRSSLVLRGLKPPAGGEGVNKKQDAMSRAQLKSGSSSKRKEKKGTWSKVRMHSATRFQVSKRCP